jgi:HPt (histidine-containing phosphotransfer) domain-containing protein
VKVFDERRFLENFEGLGNLGEECIDAYFDQLPKLVGDLRDAIQKMDPPQVEMCAHTLKGVVSNFYAERVRALAAELEKMGRAATLSGAAEIFVRLEAELPRFNEALAEFRNKRKSA